MDALLERMEQLLDRVGRVEATLVALVQQRAVKEYYTTEEAAPVLGLAEFTVRNYCRLGRIHGEKRGSGRGKYQSWVISHAELQRVQKEGLLPIKH